MADINAGSLYIGAVYNGQAIDRGLAKTKASLLGFSRFQAGIMKGVLGANIATTIGRFVWRAAMANDEVKKLSDSLKEVGANIIGYLLKPFTDVASMINEINDSSKKIDYKGGMTGKEYEDYFRNKYDPQAKQAQTKQEAIAKAGAVQKQFMDAIARRQPRLDFLEGRREQYEAKVRAWPGSEELKNELQNLKDEIKKLREQNQKDLEAGTKAVSEAERIAAAAVGYSKEGATGGFIGEAYQRTRKSIMSEWVDKAFKPKTENRAGEFMSGADVWKRAVGGSLKGQVEKEIAANTKKAADYAQEINNKILSIGGLI